MGYIITHRTNMSILYIDIIYSKDDRVTHTIALNYERPFSYEYNI